MDAGSRELMKMNVTLQYKYWVSNFTDPSKTGSNIKYDQTKPVLDYTGFQSGTQAGYGNTGMGAFNSGSGAGGNKQSVIYDKSVPPMDFGWMKK